MATHVEARRAFLATFIGAFAWSLAPATHAAMPSPREAVWAAETAFARSMRERDIRKFGELVSDEAVFFSDSAVLRGKADVIRGWTAYFRGPAPFTWEPDQVEVLASGSLALSTGPVRDPAGKVIARFTSIWRLEGTVWRVVFDKGSPPSPGPNARPVP
jgi:ketosteroid isomerase-like protein